MPVFGFGISPRGPSTRPSWPTLPIWSGVAIATSKSVKPSSTRLARSAEPTTSAPASSASLALSPSAKTATRASRPVPCGSIIVPRSCSSAWRTFRPRFMCTSTVSSNFAPSVDLEQPDRLDEASRRARDRCRCGRCCTAFHAVPSLHLSHCSTSTPIERAVPAITFIAWSTSRAFRSTSFVSAIERTWSRVRRPTLVRFGSADPFSSRSASLIRTAAGGRLRDEVEAAVLVDRDLDRSYAAVLLRRLRVERLAELHDVDTVLAERRPDRRRRVGLPARDLQLDECHHFLCHQRSSSLSRVS